MEITGFDWDDGNRRKCEKHGVPCLEIEDVFRNGPAVFPDLAHSRSEERFKAIGRVTGGRVIYVAFTLRQSEGGTRIRPVSARYMHKKEIRRYEKG